MTFIVFSLSHNPNPFFQKICVNYITKRLFGQCLNKKPIDFYWLFSKYLIEKLAANAPSDTAVVNCLTVLCLQSPATKIPF